MGIAVFWTFLETVLGTVVFLLGTDIVCSRLQQYTLVT